MRLLTEWLELLCRHIPERYEHRVRYVGWYSNRTRGERGKALKGAKRPDRRGATCRSPARDTSEIGFPIGPVITTSLYFVVFGAAIGSRIAEIEGVSYGAFIVSGLVMLLTQSVSNASFGIYFPKFTGTIYEILSAPVSALEIVVGYVGAAATKSIILGLIILATAGLFVPLDIAHPA